MAEFKRSSADGDQDIELQHLNTSENGSQVDVEADVEDDPLDVDNGHGTPRSSDDLSMRSFELYTPDEERTVLRKLDTRLVLFMSLCYLLSFLDRSNIGNAKIAGMTDDLNLHDDQFDWLLTAFYITYIGFEPMILMYHIVPPHTYIASCVLWWGVIASTQAVVTSYPVLLILRACLGAGEAAFSPGIPFYFSFFFRRDELATRTGYQLAAAPLAASFAGSLAWLITWLGGKSPFAPWRLLFLVEGFPAIAVAVFAWSFIPDSPEQARFLTPRERNIAKLRLRGQDGSISENESKSKIRKIEWNEIGQTLRDPKCYLTAIMFLCCNIAFSSMPVFLPSIVNEMGYSSLSSQALSAPPFLLAFFVLLLTCHLSDKFRARSAFVCLHAALGFVGYTMIAVGGIRHWPNFLRYLFVYPAAVGFFSAVTIIITWTMNNQPTGTRRGTGMTVLNLVGQCGPLIGTRLYPDSDKPYYVKGMVVCAAAMGSVVFMSLVLRAVLRRENVAKARVADGRVSAQEELLAERKGVEGPFMYIL